MVLRASWVFHGSFLCLSVDGRRWLCLLDAEEFKKRSEMDFQLEKGRGEEKATQALFHLLGN